MINKYIESKIKNNTAIYEIRLNKNNLLNIFYNNKALTSVYAPIEEAKRFIDSQNIKENIAIFFSIANFYHIEYFLSLNKNNKAIIIEKDALLVKNILESNNNKTIENISFIVDENLEYITKFFYNFITEENAKYITFIRHIRASNINEDIKSYYDNINISIINIIKEKIMSLTSNYYFAPIWSKNILYNLYFNKESYSIKTFYNILNKKTPLLLVSAGASIDEKQEQIKELSKTHFVLALSHSLNTLIENNINPDAVISTDGGFYSSIHLHSLINNKNDMFLFTTHTAYPMININTKKIFLFTHNESLEQYIYNTSEENNIYIPMEGSVIMPALRIAYLLNPKYIIIAGCDFCYINDKTHSKYSSATAYDLINSNKINTYETAKYKRLNINNKILCYDNEYRNTSNALISYKSHFESLIQEIIKYTDIYSLTEKSAKIDNIKIFNNINNNIKEKNIKINNYIKENINKEYLKNEINKLIENIDSIENTKIISLISPWHLNEYNNNKISKEELQNFIKKWYEEIKIFI